jgi:hypothetical protein
MKKYIVWVNYGCEGWSPSFYDTLEEAIKHESYGMDKIITTEVKFEIVEK